MCEHARNERLNWAGRKALVTGAGGFIGSHLVECLVERGAEVTAFVRYDSQASTGALPPFRGEVRMHAGDLTEYESVLEAVQGQEYLFHLGALVSIPYSYIHPHEVVQANVIGTLNILTAARESAPVRVVLTSTSEVYGTARHVPIDEEHPLQAQSPYAASKIGADKLGEAFHKSYGLPVTIARPFNTFGPRQSMRAVIPTIIVQALKRNYIHLGALSPTRDFLFVKDTVEGFLKLAECDQAVGGVFNLGTGGEVSIGELAEKISGLIGKDITIKTDENRLRPATSEVQRLCANITKARTVVGWSPAWSLEHGLAMTIEWFKQAAYQYQAERYHV